MPWWSFSSSSSQSSSPSTPDPTLAYGSKKDKKPIDWTTSLNRIDWSHYTDPRNLIPVILLTSTCIGSYAFYRSYLRRIPQAALIQQKFWRKRSLFGTVTRVGDGDNFHLFHTPGGRLAGWGWLPWRRVPEKGKELKDRTIHVRLAGVDAPELAHFGRPSQPYGQEAFDWLSKYILYRRVRAYIYRRDQYDRAVATVYVRKWLLRRDVGLQMLKKGLATVYEAKTGAEFGALESKYRTAEKWASLRRMGMWGRKKGAFESPRNYKTRMVEKEEEQAGLRPY
ncbi:MAG: hypothetical protein Q9217_004750 [Psora testacea]